MQSQWRVACVRIPRFPIGAAWQRAIAEGNGSLLLPPGGETQLLLPMGGGGDGGRSRPNAGVPLQPSSAVASSSPRQLTPDAPPVPRPPSPVPSHWDEVPIVLLDGQRVRAATAAAGRLRIRAGMTIAEARTRCAAVRVALWDEESVTRAVMHATAAFVQASPQVSPAAGSPGTWWVGVGGLDALGGERRVARHLLALARRWHPGARVGVGDSCVAARAATWAAAGGARHGRDDGLVLVPPGTCAAYLAPAPLGLVPMDEELRETLQALGVRTVGAFAALAAEDVERRWGADGVAAWHLAHGNDRRRPVLAHLDAPRAVTTDLCPSVPTMEPILFLVRAALDRLVTDLVRDGRAAAVVAITLSLDDARGALPVPRDTHTVTREIRLPRALARTIPLLERCRALLEDWSLQAPVCAVQVTVTATTPLQGAQGELLDPAWRDPAAADAAFARLRSALGTGAVVRPVLRDTHRPEAAGAWERVDGGRGTGDGGREWGGLPSPTPATGHAMVHVPTHDTAHGPTRMGQPPRPPTVPIATPTPPLILVREPPPAATPAITRLHPPPALRQLDPPERIAVRTTNGTPRAIRWRDQVIVVSRAMGPERLAGDWWTGGYARDYWRCEDQDGTCDLVIYRDCTTSAPTWYLHAWHD